MKNGGPAFPARPTERMAGGMEITSHHGMSLRDYFAASALQGAMAGDLIKVLGDEAKSRGLTEDELIAKMVYQLADAMLAEREKP